MPAVNNQLSKRPGLPERVKNALCFLSFTDHDLERRFLIKQHKGHLGFNRIVSILGFAAVSGFYLMNYLLLQPGDIRLYILPYYIAAAALGIFILMTLIDLPHYVFNTLAMLAAILISTAPLVSLMAFRYPETYFFHTGCVVLVFISIVFVRISFYFVMGFAAIYLLAFELLYFSISPHSNVETLNLHYILLFSMGVGLIVSYNMEKRERINFVKLRIIIEGRMKLSRLKDASQDDAPKTKK
jgi:hypothetical protein